MAANNIYFPAVERTKVINKDNFIIIDNKQTGLPLKIAVLEFIGYLNSSGLIEFPEYTFLELTDTPNAYTGESSKVVMVNNTEDGLIFDTLNASALNNDAFVETVTGNAVDNTDPYNPIVTVSTVGISNDYNDLDNLPVIEVDKNFAEDDLIFSDDRSHDLIGFNLIFENSGDIITNSNAGKRISYGGISLGADIYFSIKDNGLLKSLSVENTVNNGTSIIGTSTGTASIGGKFTGSSYGVQGVSATYLFFGSLASSGTYGVVIDSVGENIGYFAKDVDDGIGVQVTGTGGTGVYISMAGTGLFITDTIGSDSCIQLDTDTLGTNGTGILISSNYAVPIDAYGIWFKPTLGTLKGTAIKIGDDSVGNWGVGSGEIGIDIINGGTGINIDQSGVTTGLNITSDATSIGSKCINLTNSQYPIYIDQSARMSGTGIHLLSGSTSLSTGLYIESGGGDSVGLWIEQGSSANYGLRIDHTTYNVYAGLSGNAFYASASGFATKAIRGIIGGTALCAGSLEGNGSGTWALETKKGIVDFYDYAGTTAIFRLIDDKISLVVPGPYADNAAALGAGLVPGNLYRSGDSLNIVH